MPLKLTADDPPNINLTPMLDVVFQLLVFFMVSTQFASMESGLDVKLPEIRQPGSPPPVKARTVVHIFEDGRVALDKDTIPADQLAARLTAKKKESPNLGVVVRGDAGVKLQQLTTVLEACRQSGCLDVAIAAKLAVAANPEANPRR